MVKRPLRFIVNKYLLEHNKYLLQHVSMSGVAKTYFLNIQNMQRAIGRKEKLTMNILILIKDFK